MNPSESFSNLFQVAISRFDEENALDPHHEIVEGVSIPRELLYARRLTTWVLRLAPQASEVLQLAARAQHLCRWTIPRGNFELSRAGYLKWRAELKKFHALKAGEILISARYSSEMIERVQALILKKDFPENPESVILEDALCLLFLEFQLPELAQKTSEEKLINALQKSWRKMSPAGRAAALELDLPAETKRLLEKALS